MSSSGIHSNNPSDGSFTTGESSPNLSGNSSPGLKRSKAIGNHGESLSDMDAVASKMSGLTISSPHTTDSTPPSLNRRKVKVVRGGSSEESPFKTLSIKNPNHLDSADGSLGLSIDSTPKRGQERNIDNSPSKRTPGSKEN